MILESLIYYFVALFEGIFLIIIGFYLIIIGFYLIYAFKPPLLPFFCFFCFFIVYFVFFIPTVYCEGIEDPFVIVTQISDLSSLESKNIIREAYSGVSGIYMFQCIVTGSMYIGSSINIYGRFYCHLNNLSSNLHLQNAANKYGWDAFNFRVIETCLPADLITREQFNLDILFNNFPAGLIYNFCAIAYSALGYIHTAEAKAAMIGNTNRLGTTHTAETKAAISAAISKAIIGHIVTYETKALIQLNQPNRRSIYVYDLNKKLLGEYLSLRDTAKFLEVSHVTVRKYLASGKPLKGQYILRTSPLS